MRISINSAIHLLSTLVISAFIVSCGGSSQKQSSAEEVAFSDTEKKIAVDISKVIAELPSPSEVPYTLEATGADFNPKLVNDLTKVTEYQTSQPKAALNLGIYATDIGYLVSYNQVNESLEYLGKCQELSQTLGVSSVFDVATMEKFQNNLNNQEELAKIMNEAIFNAEKKLETSDRSEVAAMIIAGSFLEGLYLSLGVIENYPKDLDPETRNLILRPLFTLVLDQKQALLDIIVMLKNLPQSEIITKLISQMGILKITYESELADVEKQISENQGEFTIDPVMLRTITEEVKKMRTEIVSL